jgi:riboflavin synthase
VTGLTREGEAHRVTVEAPRELLPLIAEKGSVALDGVSLTVNRIEGREFEIMLIPHTMAVTTLRSVATGRKLNLEVDLVARYVVRYLEARQEQSPENGDERLEKALKRSGFLR